MSNNINTSTIPKRREVYLIEVTRPDDVTEKEMEQYIRDAVHSWGAMYDPRESLFKGHRPIQVAKSPRQGPLPMIKKHLALINSYIRRNDRKESRLVNITKAEK